MIKFLSKAFGAKKKNKEPAPKPKTTTAKPISADQAEEQSAARTEIKSEPDKTPKKVIGESPSSEREELIQNALAIHREKSKLLDNLPQAVRAKLTAMAMAIYIKQRSDNKKN